MIEIFKMNLSFLASQIEKLFNTRINELGIVTPQDELYKRLTQNIIHGDYLGYLVVPVDEDGEYLVTKGSGKNYDESNIMDKYEISQQVIPTQDLKDYIRSEFQGKIYSSGLIRHSNAPNKNNILENMTDEDNFVYLYYIIT